MHASSTPDTEVLIVGAGPTGLVLALWLTRLGVRVKVTDKTAEPGTTSRAVAVQARTLEFYGQIGLADEVVERGRRVGAANLWVAGVQVARAVFGDMGVGISPYPFALIYPQDEHERLLIDRLAELGVHVERRTELVHFEDASDRVVARLKRSDGALEMCEAAYLVGCDGAHSMVTRGAQHRFSRRHVHPPVLCCRHGSERNGDERRGARRFRQDRFSRRVPAEGRGTRSTRWHGTRGRRASTRESVVGRR
jgi:2-polyprenyl-6-methoxyphenol hydroxylase-like FAD-dependent oxidoreductase